MTAQPSTGSSEPGLVLTRYWVTLDHADPVLSVVTPDFMHYNEIVPGHWKLAFFCPAGTFWGADGAFGPGIPRPGGSVEFPSEVCGSNSPCFLSEVVSASAGFWMPCCHGVIAASWGGSGSGIVSPAGVAPAPPPVPESGPRRFPHGPGDPRIGRCAARSSGRTSPAVRGPTGGGD